MKGNISLSEFIKEIKDDLRLAIDTDDPFFILGDVELEVSFGLNAEGKAGGKFVVFDLSAKATASQTHKVKINLTPYVESNPKPSPDDDKKTRKANDQTTNNRPQQKQISKPGTIKRPTAKKTGGLVAAKEKWNKESQAKSKQKPKLDAKTQ